VLQFTAGYAASAHHTRVSALIVSCTACHIIVFCPCIQVVPEADRKVYTYKGLCIARANKGPRTWFKLYNVFPDAGGFVQHFPL
jgi:hypothetical protein